MVEIDSARNRASQFNRALTVSASQLMFESLKTKFRKYEEDNSTKNMSFDFKLMFVFHIVMMILFGIRPFDNAKDQILLAIGLGCVLVIVSMVHKVKSKWSWPGLTVMSVPGAVLNIVFLYMFFAYAAYSMHPNIPVPEIELGLIGQLISESWPIILQAISIPVFTPWYLAGVGIVAFNVLTNLKIVTLKKADFESQCRNS